MAEHEPDPAESGEPRRKRGRDRTPAALRLACGDSIAAAAAACGLGERTIRDWLAEAEFVAEVRAVRADLFGEAVGKLAALGGKAAAVLGGLLDSEAETVRRQAAVNVLEMGTKLREAADLAAEVAALRTQLEGDGGDPGPAGTTPAADGAGGGAGDDAGDGGDLGAAAG